MIRRCLALIPFMLLAGPSAQAQNVLMNSAETINKGNFKLGAYPTVLLGENGADDEFGFAARAGYGFTPSFDVEAKVAFFDGLTYFGADAEFWLVKGEVDFSLGAGIHRTDFDGPFDRTGFDVTAMLSGHVASKLELYGGLNAAFERVERGEDFTRVHLVPGIEYRLADNLDLLFEVGIGLNDDSHNYLSFGLSLYLR